MASAGSGCSSTSATSNNLTGPKPDISLLGPLCSSRLIFFWGYSTQRTPNATDRLNNYAQVLLTLVVLVRASPTRMAQKPKRRPIYGRSIY